MESLHLDRVINLLGLIKIQADEKYNWYLGDKPVYVSFSDSLTRYKLTDTITILDTSITILIEKEGTYE